MSIDIPSRLAALTHLGTAWILYLLIALSIVALAVILERTYALVLMPDDGARCRIELAALLRSGDFDGARSRAQASPSFEARVVASGLGSSLPSAAAAEQRLAGALQLAKLDMERRLAFLGTLGNNAPFIGLLGTVIGIVRAFKTLDGGAGKVSAGLMTEVGEALIATAVGILVALPAIAAFNIFQRVVKTRLARIDALGRELVAALSMERN
jgi:biopolymer transport protein ExbB/TolQ